MDQDFFYVLTTIILHALKTVNISDETGYGWKRIELKRTDGKLTDPTHKSSLTATILIR